MASAGCYFALHGEGNKRGEAEKARVVRGGAYNNNNPNNLRCAYRNRNNPDNRNNNLGFRMVRGAQS